MNNECKKVENLVVDTTAFIQNAPLHEIADNIVTCKEVVEEIDNKRQLRRLVVLPYDLVIKQVFPESIQIVTDFSKKTGDYPSLSATDIKVIALTYQLEKEKVGSVHLRTQPVLSRPIINTEEPVEEINPDITGFFLPGKDNITQTNTSQSDEIGVDQASQNEIEADSRNEPDIQKTDSNEASDELLANKFGNLNCEDNQASDDENSTEADNILVPVRDESSSTDENYSNEDEDDDNVGWITPANIKQAKKQVNSQLMEEKHVIVACMTTDFAMQNVLRQMNLNVSALDGRIIKQLRTYILRCYACFKTTSIMTKRFCPKCGNDSLKKVAASLDENGKMQIHINPRKPLTGRGKKFSLPRIKGGKHPNNPILAEDQPMADNRPTRLARTKNNPLDDDYIAGFSPFIMRDVNSKSAQLGIRPGAEFKQWMKKNPNESRRRRK